MIGPVAPIQDMHYGQGSPRAATEATARGVVTAAFVLRCLAISQYP